jgi:hypothetical protein
MPTYIYIEGDAGLIFSILGDDWIGVCEKKSSYVDLSSANGYQDRRV